MPNPEHSKDADERAAQFYTLEYQKAAERFDNVYRSIWTIFSYLAAVAAGLLTFGSDRIEPHALVCIAASPLLFWFWTTYLPLDRYGNKTGCRLGDLEKLLNDRYQIHLNHFRDFAHPLSVIGGIVTALVNPYKGVQRPAKAGGRHRVLAIMTALWGQIHRARFTIATFFILLHLLFVYEASAFRKLHGSGHPLFLERPVAASTRGR